MGVDISATCGDGNTALEWAIRRRDYELCEYLLSKDAQPTTDQQKIIEMARERRKMKTEKREKRERVNNIVSKAWDRARARGS